MEIVTPRPVTIQIEWYSGAQLGPNEVDLIRSLNFVIRTYMEGGAGPSNPEETTKEIRRAVSWLNAKYGAEDRSNG